MEGTADDYAIRMEAGDASYRDGMQPEAIRFDTLGMEAVICPPGRVAVDCTTEKAFLNVAPKAGPGFTPDYYRLDDRDAIPSLAGRLETGGFDLFARGLRHEIGCVNHGWELMVDLDEDRLGRIAAEAWDGEARLGRAVVSSADAAVMQLGRLAIDHLRSGPPDRLYVEGLMIALTARALDVGRANAAPEGAPGVAIRGTDLRVARAVDYIEAHLGDPLSVADLAAVAAMSPAWFQQCFRAATGRPVHAYVLERRCERARVLILAGRLPLQRIAEICGFSDQAHMTRCFRTRFGTTPGKMRKDA